MPSYQIFKKHKEDGDTTWMPTVWGVPIEDPRRADVNSVIHLSLAYAKQAIKEPRGQYPTSKYCIMKVSEEEPECA